MMEPFLFRFMQACKSPSRDGPSEAYVYDPVLDMVVETKTEPPVPVIELERAPALASKKKDIEKGEDQKDSRMWK